ncbi:MAG: type II toxin-antitoxin system HicB family antitoxin [Actinomycetota bacterium]
MIKDLVIIEKAKSNFSVYSPDLPGCVATGDTKDETLQRMREAIAMHLKGLREDDFPIPPALTSAERLEV